uniref:DUF551 domain-containing protein n=1 Tax=Siphoviridae sp. ctkKt3 TaxID=2825642 RepID=A0A8S5UYM3_9CAUD|nr:MAG TPA: Protein of unknown function (DUF551) [Siphoviridae sp. ctkKt3]
MIDEKKLIDKFKDWIRTDYFEDWSARNFILNDIIAEINKMPKVGEWISVSERLPDVDIEVLVSCKARITKYSYIDIDYRSKKNGKWAYLGEDVIAWQPLPEPYREESAE